MTNEHENLLDEYGADSIGGLVADQEELYSSGPADQDLDGKIAVAIGDATFYVKLPEKFVASVGLLGQESSTASERYKLTELLRVLKSRTSVWGLVNGREVGRREYLAALKEREGILAYQLRQQLQREVSP